MISCDNLVSVTVINSGRTRDGFLQSGLRELCFHAALFEVEVRAQHIPGKLNKIPDLLSRWAEGDKVRTELRKCFSSLDRECIISEQLFRFTHDW